MLITALQRAEGADRDTLLHWIQADDFEPAEKIAAVTAVYDKVGIAALCRQKIEDYYAEGLRLLDEVCVEEPLKEPLRAFVDRLMERKL